MAFMINRRTALAAAPPRSRAFPAAAQDNKRIVVGTWGGDYSRLLTKNIETPLLGPRAGTWCKDEANDRAAQGQDAGREVAAPRHLGRPGPVGRRHVRA